MPRLLFSGRRGTALTADAASFPAAAGAGAGIATLSNPFAGATGYAVIGTAPAQLALSGGRIVKGSAAATAGSAYALKVRATSADGAREIAETFSLTATAAATAPDPAPATAALPLYARSAWLGDSIVSQAVGSYMKSMQLRTIGRSGGRLVLAEAGDKGIPGTRLAVDKFASGDSILARVPRVAEQQPSIVFVEGGHNDSPSTNASSVSATIAAQRQVHAALRAALPGAIIVWQTILPSSIEGSDAGALANLASVNADRMALHGGDGGKTIAVNVNDGFDWTTMTQTVDGIHLNGRGARFVAQRLDAAVAALYPAYTVDQVLAEQGAQNGHGPNLASAKFALGGTGGAITNSGGGTTTGQVADTMLVTNATTATVVCSKDAATAGSGYERQVIRITGTASAEGTIVFSDGALANRTGISGAPGEWFEALWAYSLTAGDGTSPPSGVRSFGAVLPISVAGYSLGNYAVADPNAGPDVDVAVSTAVARTNARTQQTAATVVQNAFGLRVAAGVALDISLTLWKPIVRRTFTTALFVPLYVGSDSIKAPGEQIGLASGTVANGNTLTFRPGAWAGGGPTLGPARIYKGGAGGGASAAGSTNGGAAGGGSGTLLATLAAGSWTWPAAGLASGDSLFIEVDAANALGTATARSQAIAVP